MFSEGEQRAVALADFFTETALDENSSVIVMDDPVTSLDFAWKETISEKLVLKAKEKQVIVFTHDLHFLSCLKNDSETYETPICTHWIEKRDGIPGFISLNNCPALEAEYKRLNKVEDLFKEAKDTVAAEERERLIKECFGALRTSYEAFEVSARA